MNELYDRLAPVVNGADYGDISAGMHARLTNPAFLALHKPFIMEGGPYDGKACVIANVRGRDGKWMTANEKGKQVPIRRPIPVFDAIASGLPVPQWALNATIFRRDDWIQYQDEAELAYRENLKFVSTLQQNVQVTVPGWGKLTYEYDAMSDAHSAVQDMDGMTDGMGDIPQWLPRSVPLPFTHSDYHYSDRVLAASRSGGGTGLDVYSAEMAGRRVAELVEDVSTGVTAGLTWGTRANYFPHDLTSTVFGALTYTNRNTKTNFTAPTVGGWVPDTTYNEVLASLQTLLLDKVSGRVAIFYSIDWEQYMHRVYSLAGGNTPGETLRTMLLKHERIASVELLERLTNVFTMIIVVLDRRYVIFINGMDVRTWQWPTRGGMQQNFKTGVVQSTLFKSDFTGRAGLLVGTTV
jgi:hypothetical protein